VTFAFLDLETTGLDLLVETHCPILEVAIVLTDDNLVPFAERTLVVEPREDGTGTRVAEFVDLCEPEAFRMHTDNGLLAEIDERKPGGVRMAQEALLDFLDGFLAPLENPVVPLVGFGVGRFDVPLLARWMPDLLARFHYRTIDVRTLTEVTRRWGDFGAAPEEQRKHRALAGCREALAVLQWWRDRYMPDRSQAEPPAPHQTGLPPLPPKWSAPLIGNGESFAVEHIVDTLVDDEQVRHGPVELNVVSHLFDPLGGWNSQGVAPQR
jgi:oligoribonuclease